MAKAIFAVIPSYRVSEQIGAVIDDALKHCDKVIVVDDACPEGTAELVRDIYKGDSRVVVERHETNQGVGGATLTGFKIGFDSGYEVGVKIDGDGQIDPSLIPALVEPIRNHAFSAAKGNRFNSPESLEKMPAIRLIGNAVLSLFAKFSTGYWNLNDPNNGLIAISEEAYRKLVPQKISKDYFFESDLLFRLGLANIPIYQLDMNSKYGSEKSSLKPIKSIPRFYWGHNKNFIKRLAYEYFVKEWNVGTINLILGFPLTIFGLVSGLSIWINSLSQSSATPAGTLFLSAIPLILGFQFLFGFINYDVSKRSSL